MKLYKATYPKGVPSGCIGMKRYEEVSLDNLKQALAEHGLVAVPVEPKNSNVFFQGICCYEEMMGGHRLPDGEGYDYDIMEAIYKAMIDKAQEPSDD